MYKRGKSWYSDFFYEGERYKKSLGPVSKSVAAKKDRALRVAVADGRYVKRINNPTFEDAIKGYLQQSKAVNSPGTYRANLYKAKHLRAFFGRRRIRSIERNEVLMRRYINQRKEEIRERQLAAGRTESELTYTTINRELALLRKMFNVLIKSGKASKNPVSLVTMFPEQERERIISPDELQRIFEALDQSDKRYHHLRDMIIIALNTAMRRGEILNMKKSWVDLETGIINVPRSAQKRKRRDKRVPINSVIAPILKKRLRGPGEYVFTSPKTGGPYSTITKAWETICEKAGIIGKPGVDKLRFHDLRHTAATMLARSGKDIKFIAQFLGHRDVKTSARYIHYSDEDLKSGAEILAKVPPNFTPAKKHRP